MKAPDLRGKASRAGVSLLETIVAMVLLSYGVLGLVGTNVYVLHQVTVADLNTKRAAAVGSVMERVKAQPFDSVSSGSDTLGLYTLAWTSSAVASRTKLIQLISTGPGSVIGPNGPTVDPAAVDTLSYRLIRR